MKVGLIISSNQPGSFANDLGLLSIDADMLIVSIDAGAYMAPAAQFYTAARNQGWEKPIYPMFWANSESSFVLADMLLTSRKVFENPRVFYLMVYNEHQGSSSEFLNYLHSFANHLRRYSQEYEISFRISAPASSWLIKSAPVVSTEMLPHLGFLTEPVLMLSDSPESMAIWKDAEFLRFLHAYPQAEFTMSILDPSQKPDFGLVSPWERDIYFWSAAALKTYRETEVSAHPKGALAMGTPLVDRISAYAAPDMQGAPVRKISITDGPIAIIAIFSGAHGEVIGQTLEGDYVLLKFFNVEGL